MFKFLIVKIIGKIYSIGFELVIRSMHVSAYLMGVKKCQSQHHFADVEREIHNIPFPGLFSGVF